MNLPSLFRTARFNQANRKAKLALDKREQRILSLLNGLKESRQFLEKKEHFACFVPLWNAVQYCNIADLDLSILTYQAMTSDSDWTRKLNSRILAMTLVECVKDIAQVLGKEFQNVTKVLLNGNAHLGELQTIRKSLASFRTKHESMLREIRLIAAAHRETKADLQLVVIANTNVVTICKLSIEFTNLLDRFDNLMIKIFADLKSQIKALKNS